MVNLEFYTYMKYTLKCRKITTVICNFSCTNLLLSWINLFLVISFLYMLLYMDFFPLVSALYYLLFLYRNTTHFHVHLPYHYFIILLNLFI